MKTHESDLPTLSQAIKTAPAALLVVAWRHLNGLTQGEAAQRWGIHKSTLSRFEKGEAPKRVTTDRAIRQDVGVDADRAWS